MNCDEAFELITHPTDYNCEELQWHLQLCPRCRQMQETLAPALDPFQQFLDDLSEADQVEGLGSDFQPISDRESTASHSPTAKPFLSAESVRMAEQAATRLSLETETTQSQKPDRPQKRLFHAAVILLIGVTLGWGVSGDVSKSQFPLGVNSLEKQQPCLWIAQAESLVNQSTKVESNKVAANTVVLSCVACHLHSTTE